jgi:hypothetical protein
MSMTLTYIGTAIVAGLVLMIVARRWGSQADRLLLAELHKVRLQQEHLGEQLVNLENVGRSRLAAEEEELSTLLRLVKMGVIDVTPEQATRIESALCKIAQDRVDAEG